MSETETSQVNHYKCTNCHADLTYAPGTVTLKCDYCGTDMQISSSDDPTVVTETDFRKFLSENEISSDKKEQIHTVKCNNCGATTTLDQNTSSENCAFCGTPVIVKDSQTTTIIKPQYILPFKIKQQDALGAFKKWLAKLWFAPNKLKTYFNNSDRLKGVYIPYWTYDSDTASVYRGERGTNHTEYYTVNVNGKSERRSRTVIRWHPVSGEVSHFFDDVLVLASNSLPKKYADKLDPWDLSNLTTFNDQYLSGFKTETYQIDLLNGFNGAKQVMDSKIRDLIRRDIGGDHQRIHTVNTSYENIMFKHILLPIWISAYKFKGKVYRFMINGRTGEVQGERPWSWIKITLASLAAAAVIAGIYFGYVNYLQ